MATRSRMPTRPRASCAGSTGGVGPGPRSSSMEMSSERGRSARDACPAAAGVLQRVRERLLDDPVGRQLEGRVERRRLPSTASSTDSPAARTCSSRSPSRSRPGSGSWLSPSPRMPEHPAHVGQGEATGRVDRLERAARLLRSPVEGAQRAAGLDHDHADVVRHRVVQLAGDPLALFQDRPPARARRARARGAAPAPRGRPCRGAGSGRRRRRTRRREEKLVWMNGCRPSGSPPGGT